MSVVLKADRFTAQNAVLVNSSQDLTYKDIESSSAPLFSLEMRRCMNLLRS